MDPKEIFQYMAMPELNISCLALCTLGLREPELEAYISLLKNGPLSVNALSDILRKSRPSAQRILGQLVGKGIAYRQRKLYVSGGYVYEYHAIPPEKFREKMIENLDGWYKRSIEIIRSIPIELEKPATDVFG